MPPLVLPDFPAPEGVIVTVGVTSGKLDDSGTTGGGGVSGPLAQEISNIHSLFSPAPVSI